ncbi:MAG: hypothetical protein RSB23_05795 [Alistipes sp.]
MKKLFRLLSVAALFAAALSFPSCGNDDNNGDTPTPPAPPADPKTVIFDGTTTELKSMVIDRLSIPDVTCILLSPEADLTTTEEMMALDANMENYLHKFFMVQIASANLADAQIDVMAEATFYYSFFNLSGIAPDLVQIDPEVKEGLSAGAITSKITNDVLTLDVLFTQTDGKVLKIHAAGAVPPIPTSNILTLNEGISVVKSAFFDKQADGTALYLSPSRISSARYLEDVDKFYTKLFVAPALMNGKKVDIASASAAFEFTLCIPVNQEKLTISNNNLQGATGTFSMEKKEGENKYAVSFDIILGDYHIEGTYDDTFVVYDITIPNEYILNEGTPVALKSVVVDKTNADLYVFYLSEKAGITTIAGMKAVNPIIVKANPAHFDGQPIGFTSSPETEITFDGTLYNAANGTRGNVTVQPISNDNNITVSFQLYHFEGDTTPALVGHYGGACVSIK